MKIQSVAILGAGAVGSYVIWGLSQKEEIELGVIAEKERSVYNKTAARSMEKYIARMYGHLRKRVVLIC